MTYSDIENKAEYSADSKGINYSNQADLKQGIVEGLAPNIGTGANGQAESTTKSAIAEGTIEVRNDKGKDLSGLSRQTENALNKLGEIFDKTKTEEKQELAGLFSELAFKAIGDLAAKHDKQVLEKYDQIKQKGEQLEKLKQEGNYQEADRLEKEIVDLAKQADKLHQDWKDGGTNKTILHTLAGALAAQLGGNSLTAGALGAGLAEQLQGQLQNLSPEMRLWASAIVGTAADKIAGNKGQAGAAAAADGTKYNDLREAEIIAGILAAQKANKEVIQAAVESQNKGGGEQNQEIIEKAEKEKQGTQNSQRETNSGYQNQQTKGMKDDGSIPQEKCPEVGDPSKGNYLYKNGTEITGYDEKGKPYISVEGEGDYYVTEAPIKGDKLADEGATVQKGEDGANYVWGEDGKCWYTSRPETKEEEHIEYIPAEPEALIEKLSGQPIDLVKGAIVGIDESLGFGAGQEIYFQITQKRIDGEETTLYYAGKVLGDGTATIIGTLGMGKGAAEIGGGLVLAPETGGASATVVLDGAATTVACGKIVQNAAENLGKDWDRLEASMGSGDEKKFIVNKNGEMIGKSGTRVNSETKWQNGKTERIDIENPSPGKRPGDIHYHDSNNIKYRFDLVTGKFYDESGNLAPKKVQKILENKEIQRVINRGLQILGEKKYFN